MCVRARACQSAPVDGPRFAWRIDRHSQLQQAVGGFGCLGAAIAFVGILPGCLGLRCAVLLRPCWNALPRCRESLASLPERPNIV